MRKTMRMSRSARRRMSVAVAAIGLAFGGIVLARAQAPAGRDAAYTPPAPPAHHGIAGARVAIDTDELRGSLALTQGAVLANGAREVFGELRLEGREGTGAAGRRDVALTVVLDTSGSMIGDKIESARQAVRALIGRMRPGDRVAVVTYDSQARVLIPMSPVSLVRETMLARVSDIAAMGGTDIPAGLSLGAQALTAAPPGFSRRLVLISDGRDGSGLSLSQLSGVVSARAQEAVTTSALGIGVDYDERWLTTVADAGRGNYAFLGQLGQLGAQLGGFLSQELEQAATTVAEGTVVELQLPSGWTITSVHGAQAVGARIPLGSVFAGERRRVTLRMQVAAGAPGAAFEAPVRLAYVAATNRLNRNLDLGRLSVAVVSEPEQVTASQDVTLHAEAVAAFLDAQQALAVDAWRAGRAEEAARLSDANLTRLRRMRERAPGAAEALDARIQATTADRHNFEQLSAQSEAGRAYGLDSNASRRARSVAF